MAKFTRGISCLTVLVCCAIQGQSTAQGQHLMEHLRSKSEEKKTATLSPEEQEYKRKYNAEFSKFKANYLREFAEFKARYNQEYAKFRQDKLAQWGEVDVSDKNAAVCYVEDDVKAVVDFENEQVVISVLHDKDVTPDLNKAASALSDLKSTQVQQITPSGESAPTVNALKNLASEEAIDALISNPLKTISNASREEVQPVIDDEDVQIEAEMASALLERDLQTIDILAEQSDILLEDAEQLKKQLKRQHSARSNNQANQVTKQNVARGDALKAKRITRFTMKLPAKNELERIKTVSPFVGEFSKKWTLPTELIVAIIHTESSFNPNAVSHIPAYGLMQIVPSSAGVDVNKFLFKKDAPMKKDTLFIANKNIEAGTAYFHLLMNRYLKDVKDPMSRLYCAIAAYNTGVGNVASSFNPQRTKALTEVTLDKINGMTPDQVFEHLLQELPYSETKNYLKKVKSRMKRYSQFV